MALPVCSGCTRPPQAFRLVLSPRIRIERKGGGHGERARKRRIQPLPSSENQAARRCPRFDLKARRARPRAVAQAAARRDRIVVSALRCGRSNFGSNPSHGSVVRRTRRWLPFYTRSNPPRPRLFCIPRPQAQRFPRPITRHHVGGGQGNPDPARTWAAGPPAPGPSAPRNASASFLSAGVSKCPTPQAPTAPQGRAGVVIAGKWRSSHSSSEGSSRPDVKPHKSFRQTSGTSSKALARLFPPRLPDSLRGRRRPRRAASVFSPQRPL